MQAPASSDEHPQGQSDPKPDTRVCKDREKEGTLVNRSQRDFHNPCRSPLSLGAWPSNSMSQGCIMELLHNCITALKFSSLS